MYILRYISIYLNIYYFYGCVKVSKYISNTISMYITHYWGLMTLVKAMLKHSSMASTNDRSCAMKSLCRY